MVRRLVWAFVAFVTTALLVFGAVFGIAIHKRARADALLNDIIQVKLGTATFVDAQRLVETYGGEAWSGPARKVECSSQNCSFRFVFENTPLRYVPGVRGVEFVAGLTVEDDHVVYREIDYTVLTPSYYDFMYQLQDVFHARRAQDYEVNKHKNDAQGTSHVVTVILGPLATAEQRKRAYSIDLSCLAKLHGCANPGAIFPPGL